MKNKLYVLALAAMSILVSSCEEDYKLYDTKQTDSVFFNYVDVKDNKVKSEIDYSFGYDIAQEHLIKIPVNLMGMPKDNVRKIDLHVVTDKSDMKEGVNYAIERAEIAPNQVVDTVVLKLLRDKDPEIQNTQKQLTLAIVDNGELRPTGQDTITVKYSDIRPTTRPDWWSTWANIPEYSFENAQLFFKYFYELMPKANKVVFDEMIAAYGDYFVKAKSMQGPFAMYDAVLYKYVLIPMYNDTKNTIKWQGVPSVN